MDKRTNISSGAIWEDVVGYSRAVKIGNLIEVAGTTAVIKGELQCIDDMYGQTKCILKIISRALEESGGSMEDVVRTRIYLTDITRWKEVAKAHGEVFAYIKPASTMVEVSALVKPEMLVEIEATAVIQHTDYSF